MTLHDQIVSEVPQLRRGRVWCIHCGRMQRVDAGRCLANGGWPECCGECMSLDSPEERREQGAQRAQESPRS